MPLQHAVAIVFREQIYMYVNKYTDTHAVNHSLNMSKTFQSDMLINFFYLFIVPLLSLVINYGTQEEYW